MRGGQTLLPRCARCAARPPPPPSPGPTARSLTACPSSPHALRRYTARACCPCCGCTCMPMDGWMDAAAHVPGALTRARREEGRKAPGRRRCVLAWVLAWVLGGRSPCTGPLAARCPAAPAAAVQCSQAGQRQAGSVDCCLTKRLSTAMQPYRGGGLPCMHLRTALRSGSSTRTHACRRACMHVVEQPKLWHSKRPPLTRL